MLTFKGKPKFLEKHTVTGFDTIQTLGEIGRLQINLHSRESTSEPHLKAYAYVQKNLGEEITCTVDDWRFVGTVEGVAYDSVSRDFRLTLHDALAKFDRAIGSNVFAEQTIKDIVSGVAPAGVKIEYVGGYDGIKVKLAIQYQESALRFVKRLLSEFGGQIWCAGDKVYAGLGPIPESKSLKLDKDVMEFLIHTQLGAEQVELESIPYVKSGASTSTIELKGGRFGTIQEDAISLRKKGHDAKNIFHVVHEDASYNDTTHFANRFLRSQAAGRFVIEGRVTAPVNLGTKVTVQGIGAGAGEETAIVHSVRCVGDYMKNEIIWQFAAVNPEAVAGDESRQPGALITSTAVVEETYDDLNRVRVKFPWDGKHRATPWLRIASSSWGEKHMRFLPPRKGDTVLVVWGQNDMDPVVLGSVTAGDKVGQPKSNLMLQTVDGQTILISKDTIEMKNKDAVICMKQDQIEIDAAGSKITLDQMDIALKAKGSITLDGPTGIKLKTIKLDVG